jgi:hypothetical protein
MDKKKCWREIRFQHFFVLSWNLPIGRQAGMCLLKKAKNANAEIGVVGKKDQWLKKYFKQKRPALSVQAFLQIYIFNYWQ